MKHYHACSNPDCVVCASKRAEYERKALHYRIRDALADEPTDDQATIPDYE